MESDDAVVYKKGVSTQEKQALIESWKQSGKTKTIFCKERGVNYYTFMSWINPKKQTKSYKTRMQKDVPAFTEVKIASSTPGNLFARISVGKTSVDLFQPVSSDFIRRLLQP